MVNGAAKTIGGALNSVKNNVRKINVRKINVRK